MPQIKTPMASQERLVKHTGFTYFPLALVARMPFAMVVVGVITLVVAARDSLSLGGIVAAAIGLGNACLGPLLGVLADKFGQRSVLLIFGTTNSLLLFVMAWSALSTDSEVLLFVIAFLIGASSPQVSPLSRSRLVVIIDSSYVHPRSVKIFNSTMAYESAADEVAFVFGPLLAGLLASTMGAAAPVIGAGVISLIFVSAFALHRTSSSGKKISENAVPAESARGIFRARVLLPLLGAAGIGLFFGSMLTSLIAFMSARDAVNQVGLIYAAMGLGSVVFALGVSLLPIRFKIEYRWLFFSGILLIGTLLLFTVDSVATITICLLVMGIGVGPTLVSQYSLAAKHSPRGRTATVLTLMGTAIAVGSAFSSAITGVLAQEWGFSVAFLMPIFASLLVLISGLFSALGSGKQDLNPGSTLLT